MASEILTVPEEKLEEVIRVIRTGLRAENGLSEETREQLTEWCDDEEAYLKRLRGGE